MPKNKLKTLNLREAYRLYLLIKDVYPQEEDEVSDFLIKMLQNIRNSRPAILTEMLSMFTDKEIEDPGSVLDILVSNMIHNKIADIYDFFSVVTNGNGRI